jgi:hypothetical protein
MRFNVSPHLITPVISSSLPLCICVRFTDRKRKSNTSTQTWQKQLQEHRQSVAADILMEIKALRHCLTAPKRYYCSTRMRNGHHGYFCNVQNNQLLWRDLYENKYKSQTQTSEKHLTHEILCSMKVPMVFLNFT